MPLGRCPVEAPRSRCNHHLDTLAFAAGPHIAAARARSFLQRCLLAVYPERGNDLLLHTTNVGNAMKSSKPGGAKNRGPIGGPDHKDVALARQ